MRKRPEDQDRDQGRKMLNISAGFTRDVRIINYFRIFRVGAVFDNHCICSAGAQLGRSD